MTTLKRSASILCLLLFAAFLCRAQEQQQPAPSIRVAPGPERVTFSAGREAQQVRVEVFAPSGELVFDSGAVFGESIEWDMRGRNGRRVADGVYLAKVSTTDAAGGAHNRTEQVIVGASQVSQSAPAPSPDAPATTGSGTPGKIAKFTAATVLGDSVMTESSKRIGLNIAPTATLHVNASQPAAQAVNSGTAAVALLQTSGGKGGNTTASGKTGGKGASISLLAGTGGDAPVNGTNGAGGSITLQPGSAGTGGTGGATGNVLIAPTDDGNVGIGTNTPKSKLTVSGFSSTTGVLEVFGASASGSSGAYAIGGHITFGDGVRGLTSAGRGVFGQGLTGVAGESIGSGDGVVGTAKDGRAWSAAAPQT